MKAARESPLGLAGRLAQISGSPTLAVMAEADRLRAQGADVVDFGAGEPDFPTPEPVKEAGLLAIRNNYTRYTANAGIPELRQAICNRYRIDYGIRFDVSEGIVTHGGKHALANLMMTVLDPGDEVVIPTPHWMTFSEQARLVGGKPVLAETKEADSFQVTAELVARVLTKKTKLVVLNSPANPTGAVVKGEDLLVLGDMSTRRGFYIVWDDTYGRLSYSPPPAKALRTLREKVGDRFLIAGSASKSYSMTGWRIGWALGPKEVIAGCEVLQSHMTSNACSISQRAALAALVGDQGPLQRMLAEFRWRRDRLHEALVRIPGISCVLPEGGFYLFPRIESFLGGKMKDSADFAAQLLKEERVAVVPGLAFGRDGYVRFSFATSRERIEEGIRRLGRFLGRHAGPGR